MTVTGTCFASGQHARVSGTAFTPGRRGRDQRRRHGHRAGEHGRRVHDAVTAPPIAELGPRVVTVTALDRLNPANTATMQVKVVRHAFGSNLPVAGRPDERDDWRFAGFAAGKPIYGHFLLGGRVRGDHRFGVAQGDCGTLTAARARIPGVRALQPGRWTLRLDQRMTYREGTPRQRDRFNIVRRR